eukprot:gnl/TRDRNA2_/TRDRNA2_176340_c1_seq8.p2 gnl/TRDRNA2_/TRDRNA2_176340_c1~~gnl/TRDRNA2_/TRDRNA2_176340_c1_seq8.p2  ORF type:complete len:101 (+),score=11.08 gnl/TRDRNA2_/TRDRNA2_176340_c1_seq8:64-366(+)
MYGGAGCSRTAYGVGPHSGGPGFSHGSGGPRKYDDRHDSLSDTVGSAVLILTDDKVFDCCMRFMTVEYDRELEGNVKMMATHMTWGWSLEMYFDPFCGRI